jgi:hypothetical protein
MLPRFPALLLALAMPLPAFAAAPPGRDVPSENVDHIKERERLKKLIGDYIQECEPKADADKEAKAAEGYEVGSDGQMRARWNPVTGFTFEKVDEREAPVPEDWVLGSIPRGRLRQLHWWEEVYPDLGLASDNTGVDFIAALAWDGQFDITPFFVGQALSWAAAPQPSGAGAKDGSHETARLFWADASLQGSADPALEALRARLDALERQNKELLQKIEQGSPIAVSRPDDTKAEKERVNKLITDYIQEREAKQKAKADAGDALDTELGMTARWNPLQGFTVETANRDFVFCPGGWLSHEDIQQLNKFLDVVKEREPGKDGNPLMGLLLEPGKSEVVCGWWDVGSPPPSLASGGLETTPVTSMHLGGQFDFTLLSPGRLSQWATVPPARGGSGPADRRR